MANQCRYTITATGPEDGLRSAVEHVGSAGQEIYKGSGYGDVFLRVKEFVADERDESAW